MTSKDVDPYSILLSAIFIPTVATFPFVDRAVAPIFMLAGLGVCFFRFRRGIEFEYSRAFFVIAGCFVLLAAGRIWFQAGDLSNLRDPAKILVLVVIAANIASVGSKVGTRIPAWPVACLLSAVSAYFIYELLLTGSGTQPPPADETDLNQRVLSLVLCSFAFASVIGTDRGALPLILIVVALSGLAAFGSHSASAQLAFVVGVFAALFCYAAPKPMIFLGAIVAAALALLTPILFTNLIDVIQASDLQESGAFVNAAGAARIEIWSNAIDLIEAKPLWGWGIDAIPSSERQFSTSDRVWSHPHNQFLQIRLELGVLGSILMSGVIVLAGRTLAQLPRSQQPGALAMCAGIVVACSVSHGFWQTWWLALVALLWLLVTVRKVDQRV